MELHIHTPITKLFECFIFTFHYVLMMVICGFVHVSAGVCTQRPEVSIRSFQGEVTDDVSHTSWLLGGKLGSSTSVSPLKH